MKKALIGITLSLSVLASAALAEQIQWWVPYGVCDHSQTDMYSGAGIMDKYDVLWQLIWAGDNDVADAIDITNTAGGYVSGDDMVLGSRKLSSGDNVFDNWLTTPNEGLTGGDFIVNLATDLPYSETDTYYVYQRVFEAQTPVEGTYYYQGELVELTYEYKDLQSVPMYDRTADYCVKPTLQVQGSSVPEPATMSLLGLGALAMVLRRKLRK